MGDMFRSESMALCQMFIQPEAAYSSLAELGEKGCAQFRDLNENVSTFQRKFVSEVRRCDELARKIRYIEKELRKDYIKLPEVLDEPLPPNPRETIDIEAQLESIELEIRELAGNYVNLQVNHQDMLELKLVLENANDFFADTEIINMHSQRFSNAGIEHAPTQIGLQMRDQLNFVAGIMNLDRFFSFERMLWRISHGNVFVKHCDLSEPLHDMEANNRKVMKTVFIAFFQGEQLKQRVKKICDGYHAKLYPCPSAHMEREEMIRSVATRLEDLKLVLNQSRDHRFRVLVAASRNLPTWDMMVTKMKAIYHTLNLFNRDFSSNCLVGEAWVPTRDLQELRNALAIGSAKVNSEITAFVSVIDTHEVPPTYFRTNKFTRGFQNLIDAYGMATYSETNPGLYTSITFPFLFAVMFGDMGHGFIVLLAGIYMTWNEKKLSKNKGEIFNLFFSGRYIILLMGLFAIYTGFIYNDIFSKSINIFGTAWHPIHMPNTVNVTYAPYTVIKGGELSMLDPRNELTGIYPIGMDPIWALAENKILFLNAYKMKVSIIFGFLHMLFGVILSCVNFLHFRKYSRIVLDFLPQLLFLLLLFGYMVFMMFFKWVNYSAKSPTQSQTPGCAPSILIIFINMLLFGNTEPKNGCKEYMFEGQQTIQMALVALLLVCIPWMLLGSPLLEAHKRKKRVQIKAANEIISPANVNGVNGSAVADKTAQQPIATTHDAHSIEEEPLSEVYIKQAIHTIEYVLSTISHTASYLRLWALSLAHSQLSEVLWLMGLQLGFTFPLPWPIMVIFIFLLFGMWAFFTIAILVIIEGMSAFLHTLRLHWVEFMSKFYDGMGYAFQPFSFKIILNSTNQD